jgi:hypothetical protein
MVVCPLRSVRMRQWYRMMSEIPLGTDIGRLVQQVQDP